MSRKSMYEFSSMSFQKIKIKRNKDMTNYQYFKQRGLALVPKMINGENSNLEGSPRVV